MQYGVVLLHELHGRDTKEWNLKTIMFDEWESNREEADVSRSCTASPAG